jgi:hypothetical protein
MTIESQPQTQQELGGDTQKIGEDFAACVIDRVDPALPIVEAEFVTAPPDDAVSEAAPARSRSSRRAFRDERVEEEARQAWLQGKDEFRRYRARHRHELFAIFFAKQPGSLDEKHQAVNALLDRVSVTERGSLLGWLSTLTALTRSWEAE